MAGAIGGIEGTICRSDGQPADSANGIPGIDAEVGEDLVDLRRIYLHRPQIGCRLPGKIDILADEPAQHPEHLLDPIIYVKDLGYDYLIAGKGQELPGEIGRMLGCALNFLQIGKDRLGRRHLLQDHLGIAENAR